ncbi:uncharacterized protein [Arachis hypogaea]|uniref:uncharacterized protein n=1 Tax=Arachis hypogaea TaxID=3818 RepID=UPI003B213E9A
MAQQDEQKFQQLFQPVGKKRHGEFTKDDEGLWRYKGRICIPNVGEQRNTLFSKTPSPHSLLQAHRAAIHHCLRHHAGGWTDPAPSSSSWCSAATVVHVYSSVLTLSMKLKADGDAEGSSTLHVTSVLPLVPPLWSAFLALCSALLCLNSGHLGQKYKMSDEDGEGDDVDAMEDEDTGEVSVLGPNVVAETTEKIKKIRERILTAQSRQKSYANQRRKPLEFEVGEHLFLRVTPTTGIGREIKTKKLNPRYIGPFEILRRFGPVAYQVGLPPHLSNLYDVFRVSQLRKYMSDAAHVLEPESVELRENLTFQVTLMRIHDTSVKKL